MAEVAGLVVGVVGLAGLIGGFKSTVDVFHDFLTAQSIGRDYEILEAKLDIERTILLQWADQTRLLQEDYDRRLDDTNVQQAVSRILTSVRLLLSDEPGLKRLYGVIEAEDQSRQYDTTPVTSVSSRRMRAFTKDFEKLALRVNQCTQAASLRKKVRWVIHDKQKFESLPCLTA